MIYIHIHEIYVCLCYLCMNEYLDIDTTYFFMWNMLMIGEGVYVSEKDRKREVMLATIISIY